MEGENIGARRDGKKGSEEDSLISISNRVEFKAWSCDVVFLFNVGRDALACHEIIRVNSVAFLSCSDIREKKGRHAFWARHPRGIFQWRAGKVIKTHISCILLHMLKGTIPSSGNIRVSYVNHKRRPESSSSQLNTNTISTFPTLFSQPSSYAFILLQFLPNGY